MSFHRRAAAGALIATGALLATSVVAASPAAALTWHCKKSTKSIDTANYSGPFKDQWDMTVRNCVARSGSYVYAKAKISWDGPVFSDTGNSNEFSAAYYKVAIKRKTSGATVKYKKYYGIESKMEHSDNYGNGSYNTGTIKYQVGSGKASAAGTLALDWANCCGGYKTFGFTGSSSV